MQSSARIGHRRTGQTSLQVTGERLCEVIDDVLDETGTAKLRQRSRQQKFHRDRDLRQVISGGVNLIGDNREGA